MVTFGYRRSAIVALVAVAALSAATSAQSPVNKPTTAIRIPFESYTLANGLTVILSPDHATPTVAVDVWYHVG